jgi:hypothetical protein
MSTDRSIAMVARFPKRVLIPTEKIKSPDSANL